MVTEEQPEHRVERNKDTWRRYGRRTKWPNRVAMVVGYAVVLVAIMEALQPDDPPEPAAVPATVAAPAAAPPRPRIESPNVVERPARPAPEPKGLNLARQDFVEPIREVIRTGGIRRWDQQEAPLNDGTKRFMGESDGILLELTGNPDNLRKATLVLEVVNTMNERLIAQTGAALQFMNICFPYWDGRTAWITENMTIDGSTESVGGRRVSVTRLAELGMVMISVERA